jgi:hypothetical protein
LSEGAIVSSIAFSGALSNMSGAAQIASTGRTASAQTAPTTTTDQANNSLKDDTVKLSVAAQAKMMHKEGLSASVIAASLGTDIASVDGYLNIKVATQATTTTAASSTATESTSASTSAATTETASSEATSSSTNADSSTNAAAATTAQAETATEEILAKG